MKRDRRQRQDPHPPNRPWFKGKALLARPLDVLRFLPQRLRRLGRHLRHGIEGWDRAAGGKQRLSLFALWWLEWPLLALDCLGFSEIYELMMELGKWNSRPLGGREETLARSIFGPHLYYRRIRLDERAYIGPRQRQLCYVSFFHINSWGAMDDALLIHELVHVWQYQRLGFRYIPQALRAQVSTAGYDYGGTEALHRARREGKTLFDFNLEQQADIIADYFRLLQGRPPRWGYGWTDDLPLYEYFARPLREIHA